MVSGEREGLAQLGVERELGRQPLVEQPLVPDAREGIAAEQHLDGWLTDRALDYLDGGRYSDRPFMGAFIGAERARDAIEMAKIVFGAEFMAENPVLYCVSNTNAPLVLDANMSGSLKTYARANQPVACTPWMLAGAMSPCRIFML